MNDSCLIFTDLDGCLLNKADYRYDAAVPVLERLRKRGIPLILCSSKTQAEMNPLAEELGLDHPIVCENGGVIVWRDGRLDTVIGIAREGILQILKEAHAEFSFQSFADLGVRGIMAHTDLPYEKALRASQRQCNEPLLWEDDLNRIDEFRCFLRVHHLHLSQGGRFWHVAGNVTKGDGMRCVIDSFSQDTNTHFVSIAIGDSPIDQPMLELADIAISIPQPGGEFFLDFSHPRLIKASQPGSDGWSETVSSVLDERV